MWQAKDRVELMNFGVGIGFFNGFSKRAIRRCLAVFKKAGGKGPKTSARFNGAIAK
jgi:hypothetical protein